MTRIKPSHCHLLSLRHTISLNRQKLMWTCFCVRMAVGPPEINGSDIRSHEHSLYTLIIGGPQTAVPRTYSHYHSWSSCVSQWHGQQVQNPPSPRYSTIGNPLKLLAMLQISQGPRKLHSVRRKESSPEDTTTNFRILYVRGSLNSWGPPSTVESAGALSMPLIGVIQLQKIRDIYHELKVRVWRRRSWFHVTLQNTR